MFWGLVLKANRKYSQTIKKGFHVSLAALDVTCSTDDPVQVVLTSENHNYILCTLRKNKVEQVALDLNFAEGDVIAFTSQGNGNVHLSGYLIPESEEDIDFFGEEESENEEVESKPIKKKKQEKEASMSAKKGVAAEEEDDEDEDSDINESDEEGEEEDEDDDDDDEQEEDESSSEEEVAEPKPKQMKLDTSKQNGMENGKVQSKEKQKKDKKEKKLKQQQQQQQEKTPKCAEKTLQGGVKVEEIRIGSGIEAKPGKKVQVYYEGRLKSNNKIFDSSKTGPGFKFGLGRGEVIKGWDIGVAGMKVGGKRRIICPPNMAYGTKGSPPVIPPNSTLVFEVELKGVH